MRGGLWSAGLALALALTTSVARAQEQELVHEPAEPRHVASGPGGDPLRGSVFVFDQSASTQAAHLEPQAQQSYVPFYGWWLSLRPRWNFNEHLRVQARLDYYKEFTNSQSTTYRDEDVFDDIWTDLVYSSHVADHGPWSKTTWSLGARALWPVSKQSRGAGIYVTLGGFASLAQEVALRPDPAALFSGARFALRLGYLHPFSTATTPTSYGNFAYVRENVDDLSFVSDQLSGQTLVAHQLYALAEAGLRIAPKLEFALALVWIDQWHYAPPPATVAIETGTAQVPRTGDQQFTQLLWDIVSLDYEVLPELNLGLGYYNLTNAIAPDGQARSPFAAGERNALWSPDARIFFDITANLDAIFEDATGRARSGRRETAAAARDARGRSLAAGR